MLTVLAKSTIHILSVDPINLKTTPPTTIYIIPDLEDSIAS
jgi:hypothetical protein